MVPAANQGDCEMDLQSNIDMIDVQRAMSLQFKARNAVELKGASGIGKSDIAELYARNEGPDYGFFELNLATAMLPDVIGIQMPQQETFTNFDGSSTTMTAARFAYPY